MERGSDKHGPLLDEALKHATEALVRGGHEPRAEEWLSAEPAGEDEPEPDLTAGVGAAGGAPPGMTPEDVSGRAKLATYLERTVFPAVRTQLIEVAIQRRAPDRVVDLLRLLPSGRVFDNVTEVWQTLGGGVEGERF
ncbi:MAG: DUF2795 domain-containing protein [Mycobacteriales bacterium]